MAAGRTMRVMPSASSTRRTLRCIGDDLPWLPGSFPLAIGLPARATTRTRRTYESDEPVLVREHDGLDAVAQAQLLQQVADVRLDRGQRDHQLLGDLAVGEAAADELQHLELAGREILEEVRLRE